MPRKLINRLFGPVSTGSAGTTPASLNAGGGETLWAIEPMTLQQLLAEAQAQGQPAEAARLPGSGDRQAVDPTQMHGDVAVITVGGVLSRQPGFLRRFGYADHATLGEIEDAVNRAGGDARVRAIVLHVESPGGTVAGTKAVGDAVFAARQRKPVAAFVPDLAASAAYWIAAQASRVVVGETAKIGSIGVYAVVPDWSGFYEAAGVKVHVVKSGPFKGAGEPGSRVTDQHLADFQRVVDDLNALFVEAVARGRGLDAARAKALNDGRLHVGRSAVAEGLADAVGTLADAIAAAGGTDPATPPAPQPQPDRGASPHAPASASTPGDPTVKINAQQRALLESLGLAKGADDATTRAFLAGLTESRRAEFERLGQSQAAAGGGEAGQAGGGQSPAAPSTGPPAQEPAAAATPPAQQPDPAPQAATPAADPIAQERARTRSLRQLGRQVQMSAELVEEHIDLGTSVAAFRDMALAHATARLAPPEGLGSVTAGADHNRDTIEQAVEDAVWARLGLDPVETDEYGHVLVDPATGRARTRRPSERARQFGGRSLGEMARAFLVGLGATPLASMPMQQVCQAVFDRGTLVRFMGAAGAHSTSDFPAILANVQNKTLRRAYVEAPRLWQRFCRRVTAPDFKQISRVQLGEIPNLREIGELATIPELSVGDAKENYFLRVFGGIFGVSWQTMVNDDLDALLRTPRMMGNAGARKEDILAFDVLSSNPVMGDTKTLFHADHHNLAAGTGNVGAPSVELLNKAQAAMGTQEGLTDDDDAIILDLMIASLIVPQALRGTTLELIQSTAKPGASNNTTNIWENRVEAVVSGRLDQDSTTAWYAAASTDQVDTIEMAFLEGMDQPMITQEDGFQQLGRRYRVVHALEGKAIDWRGLYKNPGA